MIAIVVDVDSEAVKLGLKKLRKRMPQVHQRILGLLGEAVVAKSSKSYLRGGHPLNRVTGLLAQSVTESPELHKRYVVVGTNVPYGAVHEFGLTVTVPAHRRSWKKGKRKKKGSQTSRGRTKGHSWAVESYTATYPKRPFVAPAISDIMDGMKARKIIKQTLIEELKRCL